MGNISIQFTYSKKLSQYNLSTYGFEPWTSCLGTDHSVRFVTELPM